uniref:Septin 9 n=1 Tax=Podarcis muralis TaxID=64176 RepID=A0A670IL64_PODMU
MLQSTPARPAAWIEFSRCSKWCGWRLRSTGFCPLGAGASLEEEAAQSGPALPWAECLAGLGRCLEPGAELARIPLGSAGEGGAGGVPRVLPTQLSRRLGPARVRLDRRAAQPVRGGEAGRAHAKLPRAEGRGGPRFPCSPCLPCLPASIHSSLCNRTSPRGGGSCLRELRQPAPLDRLSAPLAARGPSEGAQPRRRRRRARDLAGNLGRGRIAQPEPSAAMSDPAVNAHLEGIISDFEALKRSFEVEEADQPPNSSTPQRRTPNPLARSTVSSSTQKFQDLGTKNSETPSRHVESAQRSPKSSLRRVELSGPKHPEPVSRRTEISIDISSKQVENSTPGASRFGLKRADVLGHKPPETTPRRTEISIGKPQDQALRRMEVPSKIPEPTQRRMEAASPPVPDVATKRVEIQVAKSSEVPVPPVRQNENVELFPTNQHLPPEPKLQPAVTEIPPKCQEEAIPSYPSGMMEATRDAGIKQAPPTRTEKPAADFAYVGIDAILEQMRRKAMKQGFEFNIMVVGQSGLGKSTLINTLFKSKISRKSVQPSPEERIPKTIEIKSITHDIEEKGVRMKLTVIDTPGFGDHINNENCWQPIMKFINDQYEKYLQEELNINRKKRIPDTRVHCCIYFIPATGHSLRPLDIEFMRRLSKVVNIVPVIAKADTLTLEERDYFKQRITADLLANGIDVYPQKQFDEDSEDRLINEKFREMIPFAVVGSDQEYQINGRRILGRKTKWGTIEGHTCKTSRTLPAASILKPTESNA